MLLRASRLRALFTPRQRGHCFQGIGLMCMPRDKQERVHSLVHMPIFWVELELGVFVRGT